MSLAIYAENFRSYPLIEWSLPNGLTLIDGHNSDTRGSNLAGKTTLLDSWFWCRYGWLPKWDGPKGGQADAVIRRGFDKCVVRVTEQFAQDTIEIQRERPSKLIVKKNGVVIKGMDQNSLDILLGMNASQFLISVYLKQKRRKSFYWMSDAERTELLSTIANLEKLDDAFEVAKKKKEQSANTVEAYTSRLEILNTELQRLPEKIALAQTTQMDRQSEVNMAKDNLHKRELDLKTYSDLLDTALKNKIEEQENKYLDTLTQVRLQQCELQGRLNGLNQSLKAIPAVEAELVEAKNSALKEIDLAKESNSQLHIERRQFAYHIAMVQTQLNHSNQGHCEACKQALPENESVTARHNFKLNSLIAQIANLPLPIDVAPLQEAYDAAYAAVAKRTSELSVLPNSIKKDISILEIQLNQKKNEAKSLEQSFEMFKREAQHEYNKEAQSLKNDVAQSQIQLERATGAYEVAQENCKSLQSEEALITNGIQEYDKIVAEAQTGLDEALDLLDLFGPKGFRAVCYDGLVVRIAERASQLLGVMTENMYSTRIDQVGADSKGQQKLILKPVLLKNGIEVPLDDLSGGAETRVALAYDVAISEAQTQNLPLLLDETLEGLDAVGKSEAMALLEEISKHRSVLVIDHASEFKAMFNQVVRVFYQAGESRLESHW